MSTPIDLNNGNFEAEVLKSDKLTLVDFWAPWCGPCRVVSPIVEEIATELAGSLKVAKLNVDDNAEIQMRYNIMSIPTLKLFMGGNVVGEIVGAAPKATILEEIKKHLK